MSKKQEDSVSVYPTTEETNQSRTVGMFLASSNYDRFDEINKFTQMSSNPCGGKK